MSEPPEILGHLSEPMATEVTRFITLNRRTLLLYWHGRIDSAEMIDQIVSVSQR